MEISESDISGSQLQDSLEHGATMDDVDLSCGALRPSDLRASRLSDVNLIDAHFTRADLTDASLFEVSLGESDHSGGSSWTPWFCTSFPPGWAF